MHALYATELRNNGNGGFGPGPTPQQMLAAHERQQALAARRVEEAEHALELAFLKSHGGGAGARVALPAAALKGGGVARVAEDQRVGLVEEPREADRAEARAPLLLPALAEIQ